MEILLFLQPFAVGFIALPVVVFLLSLVIMAADALCEGKPNQQLNSILKKLAVVSVVTVLLLGPVAGAWSGFKQVLIYRAVTSETTEKAIDTLEKLLDKLGVKIDEL